MKVRFALAALAAACLSTVALAQPGPGMEGRGMGPGMMGGPGGGMGQPGCPMEQGMKGGPGMGPGMGQGMAHGMGHGRMGGGMGQGMGHGRMGGGMGMEMAGPFGGRALESLNLTAEQKAKVTEIRRDLQRKRHGLMGSMHEARWQAEDARKGGEIDDAAARKAYDAVAAVRKQMFEAGLEARSRIRAVLTKEQVEKLRQAPPRRGAPPVAAVPR